MSTAQHTPSQQWYVMDWARRSWFGDDELTARTYLHLMMRAFDMKPGVHVFLGRDVPPQHIVKAQHGSAA